MATIRPRLKFVRQLSWWTFDSSIMMFFWTISVVAIASTADALQQSVYTAALFAGIPLMLMARAYRTRNWIRRISLSTDDRIHYSTLMGNRSRPLTSLRYVEFDLAHLTPPGEVHYRVRRSVTLWFGHSIVGLDYLEESDMLGLLSLIEALKLKNEKIEIKYVERPFDYDIVAHPDG